MFSTIGPIGFLLIFITILILFGPKKLPELGRSAGKTIKAFRSSLNKKDE